MIETMETPAPVLSRAIYLEVLRVFDFSLCEAIAVGQAQASRMAAPNVGYATHVFARMASLATSIALVVPLSRWRRTEFEHWDFGAVAGYTRGILEAHLLFNYLIAPSESHDELRARINIMHMNDCVRRIEFHQDLGANEEELRGFEEQRAELQKRLESIPYFLKLPESVQRACVRGKYLMIATRDEMLERVGFDKGQFDAFYDLCSQHTHVLPMSFYRMEPNGRGTGIENNTDRSYLAMALMLSAKILEDATNTMVLHFTDVAGVRRGTASEFSPGPHANRRRPRPSNAQVSPPLHPLWDEFLSSHPSRHLFAQSLRTRV